MNLTPLRDVARARRLEADRAEALTSRLRDLRGRTDELFRLQDQLATSRANIDRETAALAEAWTNLRRAEERAAAREHALAARERAQGEREGRALQEVVSERLEHGRQLLNAPADSGKDITKPLSSFAEDRARRALADQIIRAGQIRRGEIEAEPLPADATARAIVLAGRSRRGEIADDDPRQPQTERERLAAAIIEAGKRRRGELP
jgi:hypothetical protein